MLGECGAERARDLPHFVNSLFVTFFVPFSVLSQQADPAAQCLQDVAAALFIVNKKKAMLKQHRLFKHEPPLLLIWVFFFPTTLKVLKVES